VFLSSSFPSVTSSAPLANTDPPHISITCPLIGPLPFCHRARRHHPVQEHPVILSWEEITSSSSITYQPRAPTSPAGSLSQSEGSRLSVGTAQALGGARGALADSRDRRPKNSRTVVLQQGNHTADPWSQRRRSVPSPAANLANYGPRSASQPRNNNCTQHRSPQRRVPNEIPRPISSLQPHVMSAAYIPAHGTFPVFFLLLLVCMIRSHHTSQKGKKKQFGKSEVR
jgi:hypothetical protein